jgi:hypothetical protein
VKPAAYGVLALTVLSVATGCDAAVYGSGTSLPGNLSTTVTTPTAVTTPSASGKPQFGGRSNLLPNGSFDLGTSPWQPNNPKWSKLFVTKSPHRFGKTALLVRPVQLQHFGVQAVLVGHPAEGSSYRFGIWADPSPDLRRSRVVVELSALKAGGTAWTKVATHTALAVPGWRHITVTAKLPIRRALYLRAIVFVERSITLGDWLALDGATLRRLSRGAT